jgi:hypothetical protein
MKTDDDLDCLLEGIACNDGEATKEEWHRLAQALARNAEENNFESHWGYVDLQDIGKSCIFQNRGVYNSREENLAEFRRRMEEKGIAELGFALYPEQGEQAGYTFAMILDCREDGLNWAQEVWKEMFLRPFQKQKQEAEPVAV